MEIPKREITVQIKVQTTVMSYVIKYPNTGDLIDIELLKVKLAKGQYGDLADANTNSAQYSRYIIDMIATFNILMPDLKKDMGVINFSDLDPLATKTLLNCYLKEVLPWLQKWFEILNSTDEVSDPK